MSKYSYTESMTIHLSDFGEKVIMEYMESKGYEFVNDEDSEPLATEVLIEGLKTHHELLYQEKENIRMFFDQDKFKSIPNKDLIEFLNKYP